MTQLEKDVQKLAEAFQRDWLDRAIARMNSMTPYPNKEQRIKILTEEKAQVGLPLFYECMEVKEK